MFYFVSFYNILTQHCVFTSVPESTLRSSPFTLTGIYRFHSINTAQLLFLLFPLHESLGGFWFLTIYEHYTCSYTCL